MPVTELKKKKKNANSELKQVKDMLRHANKRKLASSMIKHARKLMIQLSDKALSR